MSNLIGQKQAVVSEVKKILGTNFESGVTIAKKAISSDDLVIIRDNILASILAGHIKYNGDASDAQKLKRYTNGMIQNHFRKAKELNGGVKYAPTNPGTGRRDSTLLNLKRLLTKYDEGSDKFEQVLIAISDREVELTEERKAAALTRKQDKIAASIDTSVLSPELANVVESSITA